MKSTLKFAAVAFAFTAMAGVSQAGCDLFEHFNHEGEKLALKDNECAILSGTSDAACEGLTSKVVEGWNDRISSVVLNHNSRAYLITDEDGVSGGALIQGSGGVKELAPEFNDQASVVICRQ